MMKLDSGFQIIRSAQICRRWVHAAVAAVAALLVFHSVASAAPAAQPERLKVLFLGDNSKLMPAEFMADLTTRMLDRNIEVYYSEDPNILLSATLPGYHAILINGDHKEIGAAQEAALLKFVESGRGLLAVHSGGMNFPKSKAWAAMVGAKSKPEGPAAELTALLGDAKHPLVQGYKPFTSMDVPLAHSDLASAGTTVLETRKKADGSAEPVTWVRSQGKGKVFYTAWGSDYRTWINEGFNDLIERAIRWTANQDVPSVMASRVLNKPFKYAPAKIAYRRPSEKEHFNHPDIPQTFTEKQLPLTPEESMRRMVTPAGFEVVLFAAEPNIRKAITMNWDERGRLWVAETIDYPNELRKEGGKDRISICEDTDGDGKADKFTVFAENLNIPTSLTFANGGVIVHQAPGTLFLKDTNGDDKADVREVLFQGWGLKDTHAGPNNLNYGFDNWIWGSVGYSGFKGKVGGEDLEFGNATYRFKQDGSKLEFLAQGHRNLQGFGLSEEGDLFATGANGAPSINLPLAKRFFDLAGMKQGDPTHTYESARGLPIFRRFRQYDGYLIYTAGTGHYLYTARNYPEEYWNKIAFVNEPTLGVVGQWTLRNDGCGYKALNHANLIASDDEYFSPIVSRVGPDGAVWVLDWYNFIIQHNPAPPGFKSGIANAYETDLRDQDHGRVYRIVYTGGKPDAKLPLDKATSAQLVATLSSPNMLWRMSAQRLLVERKPLDAVPALVALVKDASVDKVGLNVGAIHACRALSGMGALDNAGSEAFKAVAGALKHSSRGVRSNAVKSLPAGEASVQAIISSGILGDPEVKVQLAAYEALADQSPSAAAGPALVDALARGVNDRWVKVAATAAARTHSKSFLAAAEGKGGGAMAGVIQAVKAVPADDKPAAGADDKDRVQLELGLIPSAMKFDKAELTVKAGQKVRLTFKNNDLLEHNLVIVKPGTLPKVGALADALASKPGASEKQYVPDSPDVLVSSKVLDPGQSDVLLFTAPEVAGQYPFVCTFPGHWQIMRGILVVEPAK
jgi:putative membrane-bound dehydrogenase-like protein